MIDILLVIIGILLLIVMVFVPGLFINHRVKLREEEKMFKPLGKIVNVNDSELHVYAKGEKKNTIVFLSGHGTSFPTLDFKPLWSRLVDDFRIVVVERPGYGWSQPSKKPKDLDFVLEETRKALKHSNEEAPYILFPHSMSGLEAIYWAQKYPNEVKAIVGLDACTPKSIDVIESSNKMQVAFMYLISRIGFTRLLPKDDIKIHLPIINSMDLTDQDKKQYLAVFYRRSFTRDMLKEIGCLKDNAKIVEKRELPIHTPMLFFISDEQEKVAKGWKQAIIDFLSEIENSDYKLLHTSHYVHYEKSDVIAKESKTFLKNIV